MLPQLYRHPSSSAQPPSSPLRSSAALRLLDRMLGGVLKGVMVVSSMPSSLEEYSARRAMLSSDMLRRVKREKRVLVV